MEVDPEWTRVDRVLDRRGRGRRGRREYLVRWRGLGYGGCTWEHGGGEGVQDAVEVKWEPSVRKMSKLGATRRQEYQRFRRSWKRKYEKPGAARSSPASGAAKKDFKELTEREDEALLSRVLGGERGVERDHLRALNWMRRRIHGGETAGGIMADRSRDQV